MKGQALLEILKRYLLNRKFALLSKNYRNITSGVPQETDGAILTHNTH